MKPNKIKSKLISSTEFPKEVVDALAGYPDTINKLIETLPKNPAIKNVPTDFQKTADDIILGKYTPAGIVVNEAMDIVHFRGRTADYLEQAPGKPSHHLLNMAKDGLAFELHHILDKVKKENIPVISENIPLVINGSKRNITIEAMPLPNMAEPHYLILFHDKYGPDNKQAPGINKKITARTKTGKEGLRIQQLEMEIAQMRIDMLSITEDQEAAFEELQSANEELQSSGEDMQGLNDELESSKEELQATNDKLTDLNRELIGLNEEVTTERNYTESIIATVRVPLLVLDKNLRIKRANSAFYKTFRVNEQETERELIYDLGNKQWDIAKLHELLEEILPQKTKITDYEVTHRFPEIGERVMQLNASEIMREKGEEKLILLSIQDITEKARLQFKEEELLKKDITEREENKIKLEKSVEERTIELEQANKLLALQSNEKEKWAEELIIANKELAFQNDEKEKRAEELIIANKELAFQNDEKEKRAAELITANKELESFTYVSSHDLQEPLRKIQTFANRILDKEFATLSESGKDYFHRMHNAARRMQTLIEDLLAYSHTNVTERKFENMNLHKIVEEIKDELRETLEENQVTIEATELCPAKIIPFQFRQLLNNLISNAVKFSNPETPPHIIIKSVIKSGSEFNIEKNSIPVGWLSPEKKYCHITFADNGIGFDPQYKDKIFEVFQRLHGKEEYEGTGIGLAIVKKIVENHKGIITADSALGKGATFNIYIPAF